MPRTPSTCIINTMDDFPSGLCLGIKHNGSVWPGTHGIAHYKAKESDGVGHRRASNQCRNHTFYGMDSHTNRSVMWWSYARADAENVA